MKRIGLSVAYDGTEYAGWQIQEHIPTVEGTLTDALRELLREDVELTGASRTDAGVHALGNVAVFDTRTSIPPERIALAVNRYLPGDIRVQKSWQTAEDFHPRHCESQKTYEYTILNTPIPIPVMGRYSYHVYGVLDTAAMEQAAGVLVGTHDFSAFCSAGSQVKSKVRTVHEICVETQPLPWCGQQGQAGNIIRIRVRGNGFLYNMVRIIAGTLIEVGRKQRTVEMVKEALTSGKRANAGATAPARGLMLCEICYAAAFHGAEEREL